MLARQENNTLASLFLRRFEASPNSDAYIQYNRDTKSWDTFSWQMIADEVACIQQSLKRSKFAQNSRMAIMLNNGRHWVQMDLAAQGLGMITVPVYTNDRAENVGHIIEDAQIDILVIENTSQLIQLLNIKETLNKLKNILVINDIERFPDMPEHVVNYSDWLYQGDIGADDLITEAVDPAQMATIVYTSGTTGKPKGVMLSHTNIINNIYSGLSMVEVYETDRFLSFLPLSHMLERSIGFYLPLVTGSSVAFSRSIPQLANDLLQIKPTIMVSVPRIFERVYAKIQDKLASESPVKRFIFNTAINLGWRKFEYEQGDKGWSPSLLFYSVLDNMVGKKVRDQLGGQLRFTVCGGAALSEQIAKFFIGLGIPILQGYGLTETSPVISVNKLSANKPASVGMPMTGIEVRVGDNDELLTRSDSVMLGYWNNQQATDDMIDSEGWLHTGDKVSIRDGHIFITGRIKEIIVLGNGEKIPPSDMELAISLDPMIEQVMVVGEGRPFLSALLVLNEAALESYMSFNHIAADSSWNPGEDKNLNKKLLSTIKQTLRDFPGYAKIRRIVICPEPWSTENGLLTPTLKMKRQLIEDRFKAQIQQAYDSL